MSHARNSFFFFSQFVRRYRGPPRRYRSWIHEETVLSSCGEPRAWENTTCASNRPNTWPRPRRFNGGILNTDRQRDRRSPPPRYDYGSVTTCAFALHMCERGGAFRTAPSVKVPVTIFNPEADNLFSKKWYCVINYKWDLASQSEQFIFRASFYVSIKEHIFQAQQQS